MRLVGCGHYVIFAARSVNAVKLVFGARCSSP